VPLFVYVQLGGGILATLVLVLVHVPQARAHLLLMLYPLLDLDVQVNNCLVEHYVMVGHAVLPERGMPPYPFPGGLPVLLAAAQATPLVVVCVARPLGSTTRTLALRGRKSMVAATSLRR
jgi:hypothetical protein